MRALLSAANRGGFPPRSASCSASTSTCSPPTGRVPPHADGIEVASSRPDGGATLVGGQSGRSTAIYPILAANARAPPGASGRPRPRACSTSSWRQAVRAPRSGAATSASTGHRDDRRRRRGAPRAGCAQRAGVVAVCDPAHYGLVSTMRIAARCRRHAPCSLRRVQHDRRVLRDRRLLNQIGGAHPKRLRDGPREGRRPAIRREPAPAGGVHRETTHRSARSPTPPSSTGRS